MESGRARFCQRCISVFAAVAVLLYGPGAFVAQAQSPEPPVSVGVEVEPPEEQTMPGEEALPGEEPLPGEESPPDEQILPDEEPLTDAEPIPGEETLPSEKPPPGEEPLPDEELPPDEESLPGETPPPGEVPPSGEEILPDEEILPWEEPEEEHQLDEDLLPTVEAAAMPLYSEAGYDLTGAVYVNGITGRAGAAGTQADPHKSVEAAILAMRSAAPIVITGTVTIEEGKREAWFPIYGNPILRGTDEAMVVVKGALTLTAVTMDGRNVVDPTAKTMDTMIVLYGSSYSGDGYAQQGWLSASEGTVLQNNYNQGDVPDQPGFGGNTTDFHTAAGHGGAIRCVDGTIKGDGFTVQNNRTEKGFGGGIFLAGGPETHRHASLLMQQYWGVDMPGHVLPEDYAYTNYILNNHALSGGGIYAGDNARVEITHTEIAYNTCYDPGAENEEDIDKNLNIGAGTGAGIRISPTDKMRCLEYNYIHDNETNTFGAGIFVRGSNTRRGIAGNIGPIRFNRLSDNNARFDGGGMWFQLDDNGQFTEGESFNTDFAREYYFDGNLFEGNSGRNGGGAYIDFNQVMHSYRNSYVGNTAAGSGGGVYIRSQTAEGAFTDKFAYQGNAEDFIGNTAEGDGGGLYIVSGFVEMKSLGHTDEKDFQRLQRNTAGGSGGGLYLQSGRLYLTDVICGSFNADEAGAADGNTAGLDGGGLCVRGGVVRLNGSSADGTDRYSRINNNTAQSGSGGGAYVLANRRFSQGSGGLERAMFGHNTAGQDGGGLYLEVTEEGDFLRLAYNIFTHNTAGGSGGAMWFSYLQMDGEFTGATNRFEYNTAGDNGGGMYLQRGGAGGVFTMGNGILRYNAAGRNGGAIYLDGCLMHAPGGPGSGFTITGNTAGEHGGGIYADEFSRVRLGYGVYTGNAAGSTTGPGGIPAATPSGGNGGAVYVNYQPAAFAVVEEAIANVGGLAAPFAGRLAVLYYNTYTGNTALGGSAGGEDVGNGGAVYLRGQPLEYLYGEGVRFSGNTAARLADWQLTPDDPGTPSWYYARQVTVESTSNGMAHALNNYDIGWPPTPRQPLAALYLRCLNAEDIHTPRETPGAWNGKRAVAGAAFSLYSAVGCENPSHSHDRPDAPFDPGDGCWQLVATAYSGETGLVTFEGLPQDVPHALVAESAPVGYAPAGGVWLLALGDGAALTPLGGAVEPLAVTPQQDGEAPLWLPHRPEPQAMLPAAGGPGTAALVGLGAAVMCATVLLALARSYCAEKRRQRRRYSIYGKNAPKTLYRRNTQ